MDASTGTKATLEDFVARAQALVPTLEKHTAECQQLRRLPDAAAEAIREARLHRIMQPKRFGGHELGWDTACAVAMTLGGTCPSQAWVAAIYADHANQVGRFPIQAQEEVWRDRADVFISSSLIPKGQTTTPVDGGYVLDGQYGFSSGVFHAEWGIIGCLRKVDGEPPEYFYCLVPSSDWTLIDDWDVTGMRGTGSCSIELKEVFVPGHRTLTVLDALHGTGEGSEAHNSPVYRTPHRLMGPFAFAAVAVGAAEAVVEEYVARVKSAPPGVGADPLFAHMKIGESAAEIAAARRTIMQGSHGVMEEAANGTVPADYRRILRRDAPFAMKLVRQAADRIYAASGARGLYQGDRIHTLVHDINAIATHIGLRWDMAAPLYAQHRLGLEVPPTAV